MKYEVKKLSYPISEWFGTFDTREEAEKRVARLREMYRGEIFIIKKIYPAGAAVKVMARAA